MNQKKRLVNVLGAGMITLIVLALMFFLGGAAATGAESVETKLTGDAAAVPAQNTELLNTITALQAQQAEYEAQIEQANVTIEQLLAAQNPGTQSADVQTLQAKNQALSQQVQTLQAQLSQLQSAAQVQVQPEDRHHH